MEPVRILHTIYILNRGGMESRIIDLYRHLDRDRFQFDFYIESGSLGVFDAEVSSLGGRVYYNKRPRKCRIPNMASFGLFLESHSEYRIVFSYNQWSGFYLRIAKENGIPHRIAYARTSLETKSIQNIVKNILKKSVNLYATNRFAVSQKAAYWLFGKKMVDNNRVTVFPNAINSREYAYDEITRNMVRKELGLDDSFTIIHVGNIRFEKNHKYVLRVFSEVKSRHEDAKLILVGGGNFQLLMPLISKLDITESVIYLGVRDDVPQILQAADVFVFPSLYEGFPGAVLEAEASGLNCIISDSITSEVILTSNVVVLSANVSPAVWAKRIDEFIEHDRYDAWIRIKELGYDIEALSKRMTHCLETMV